MIFAERKPPSARVIAAVIFLVRFWIEPKMNGVARQHTEHFAPNIFSTERKRSDVLRIYPQCHRKEKAP